MSHPLPDELLNRLSQALDVTEREFGQNGWQPKQYEPADDTGGLFWRVMFLLVIAAVLTLILLSIAGHTPR